MLKQNTEPPVGATVPGRPYNPNVFISALANALLTLILKY
jgi:Ni,Fe-hydrogenase III small subunit